MPETLAVQLYSVRHSIAEDRNGMLRRLAGIGYGAVEPYSPRDDPSGFRSLADDLGLQVCATHAVELVRGADPAEVFDAVHTLGTTKVIVPGGIPKDEFTTGDGLKRVAGLLNGLAERAAAHGLELGYHNHEHELESIVDGRHALDVLADLLAPEVFLEIDTYWAALGGADVPALLARQRDRVRLLHVKDGPVAGGASVRPSGGALSSPSASSAGGALSSPSASSAGGALSSPSVSSAGGERGDGAVASPPAGRDAPNVAVGSGGLPVPDYLAAAPDAWRVVEFDHCATDVFDALEQSRAYLTTLT